MAADELTEDERRVLRKLAVEQDLDHHGLPRPHLTWPPDPAPQTDDLSVAWQAEIRRRRAEWEAQLERDRIAAERREAEAAERWAANAPRRAAAQAALPVAEAEYDRLNGLAFEALEEVRRLRREATE